MCFKFISLSFSLSLVLQFSLHNLVHEILIPFHFVLLLLGIHCKTIMISASFIAYFTSSVNPHIAVNNGLFVIFVAILNPDVKLSNVSGVTPVAKNLSIDGFNDTSNPNFYLVIQFATPIYTSSENCLFISSIPTSEPVSIPEKLNCNT